MFVNNHFLELTGWTHDEGIGKDWFEMFIPAHMRQEVRRFFRRLMVQKDMYCFSSHENEIVTRAGVESPQQSPIESIETRVDGKLIIQGIEDGQETVRDGAGWSISIMDPEGTMVLAAAGDGFAVVGLGACVPKP